MAGLPVGSFVQGADVGRRRGNALAGRSVGRRVAGDGPEQNGVVEEKVTGVGMLKVKQKGKERGAGVKCKERNERNRKRRPPERSGRDSKGLDGGLEGLWGGALQGCETTWAKTQRVSNEGRNGKIAPARARRWVLGWAVRCGGDR